MEHEGCSCGVTLGPGGRVTQGKASTQYRGRPGRCHPELTQSQSEVGRGRREDSQVVAGGRDVLQRDHHLFKGKATCVDKGYEVWGSLNNMGRGWGDKCNEPGTEEELHTCTHLCLLFRELLHWEKRINYNMTSRVSITQLKK